jgi:hypothetical protein
MGIVLFCRLMPIYELINMLKLFCFAEFGAFSIDSRGFVHFGTINKDKKQTSDGQSENNLVAHVLYSLRSADIRVLSLLQFVFYFEN